MIVLKPVPTCRGYLMILFLNLHWRIFILSLSRLHEHKECMFEIYFGPRPSKKPFWTLQCIINSNERLIQEADMHILLSCQPTPSKSWEWGRLMKREKPEWSEPEVGEIKKHNRKEGTEGRTNRNYRLGHSMCTTDVTEQQSQGRYTASWLVDKMQVVAGGGWLHSPLLSSVDVQAYCVAAFTSAFFFLSAQSSYGLDWMCTLSSVLSVFGLMLLALMVFATCTVECSESLMKHCM